MNKKAQLETSGGNGLESTNVEDVSVPLEHIFEVAKLSELGKASLLRHCTFLFAALIAIWETYKEKRRLTYWRKVTGGKTTFFEAIFHRFFCMFCFNLYIVIKLNSMMKICPFCYSF